VGTISKTFASQSRSCVLHLHNQLVATRKGQQYVTMYFSTMRGYVDEMAAIGKPLDDDDIVSYILNGLDVDYNSLIEHVNGMTEPFGLESIYARLLDTEAHLASQKAQDQMDQYHMLANEAARSSSTMVVTRVTVAARVATMEVMVSLVILTTLIKITNVRCVGSWVIALFGAGNTSTRIILVLRSQQMQLPQLIILIQRGMLIVLPLITLLVILTS
jgi:hypothetical protein